MHVIVTCKYGKERMKNSLEKVETAPFSHHNPICYDVVGSSRISSRISNSSKLSCMLSLPANIKRIQLRIAEKKWRHRLSHYEPIGIFFRRSRAANSAIGGPIRLKFELVRALMHVIVTCKYEKERMKNSREKVETPPFPTM